MREKNLTKVAQQNLVIHRGGGAVTLAEKRKRPV